MSPKSSMSSLLLCSDIYLKVISKKKQEKFLRTRKTWQSGCQSRRYSRQYGNRRISSSHQVCRTISMPTAIPIANPRQHPNNTNRRNSFGWARIVSVLFFCESVASLLSFNISFSDVDKNVMKFFIIECYKAAKHDSLAALNCALQFILLRINYPRCKMR